VGTIEGGTTVNTIAAQASALLDIRSEDSHTLVKIVDRIHKIAAGIDRPGVSVSSQIIGRRPAGQISDQHPLVKLASGILQNLGIQPYLGIASTDANIPLSRGLPAICIGITTGSHAHTSNEYIKIEPVRTGLQQLFTLVNRAWETVPPTDLQSQSGSSFSTR
jgi:tripeptide aminopeptidase